MQTAVPCGASYFPKPGGRSPKTRLVFRSRVSGPNVVSIHEEGGTVGRPTGLCFLWLDVTLVTHPKTHFENSKSHKRRGESHDPRPLSNKR